MELCGLDGRVVIIDSVTQVRPEHEGAIVVTGSHGGRSSAGYALAVRARLYVFNDAGVGRDEAGIAALVMLEDRGVAAVAVAASSSRIGDAQDTLERGVISHANGEATKLDLASGQAVRDAIERVTGPLRS